MLDNSTDLNAVNAGFKLTLKSVDVPVTLSNELITMW
jgi:hypothetical protein